MSSTNKNWEFSGHSITTYWLRKTSKIIGWILGVVNFSCYNTVEGWLSDVWREEKNNTRAVRRRGGKPLAPSTETENSQTKLPCYPTGVSFYISYSTLWILDFLLSRHPKVQVQKSIVFIASIELQKNNLDHPAYYPKPYLFIKSDSHS